MTNSSQTPSSTSLPSSTPSRNNANMDTLPLELKQRICSLLTPKELKPIRLTSTIFAKASERYFIDRFILFNFPDSIAALDEIIHHEVFGKYLTTLVCDTSYLKVQRGVRKYRDRQPYTSPPSWDHFRPKTLVLSNDESYGSITMRVMQRANDEYQTACRDWETTNRRNQALRDWYYTMLGHEENDAHHLKIVAILRKAFERCPRLRNLVLSSRHTFAVKKRRRDMLDYDAFTAWGSTYWSKYLKTTWKSLSQLESLTIISTGVKLPPKNRSDLVLPSLKHLRIHHPSMTRPSPNDLANYVLILRGAKSLETLRMAIECDITSLIESIRSVCLRDCLLTFKFADGGALVRFLLHHATTLQRLGLMDGDTNIDWTSICSNIAGRMPAIQRVQFENLGPNDFTVMTPESAKKVERFVAFGGAVPVVQYGDEVHPYVGSDRGTHINGPNQSELPSGLWQDYERTATEDWDE